MTQEDAIFENIRAMSDEADDAGLFDVAMVLEFALDVFLKETGRDEAPAIDLQANDAVPEAKVAANAPRRREWSMTTFPLAHVMRQAS